MKKILLFIPLVMLAPASCKNAGERPLLNDRDAQMDGKAPAMEIAAEFDLDSYERPLDAASDAAFIDASLREAMHASGLYADGNAPLTWTESAQIPFRARITEHTSIFADGTSEYVQTTELDPDTNPLLGIRERKADLSNAVAKITIKDGVSTTYNNSGEVLASQKIEMPDYSCFLAEMRDALAEKENETKSGVKRDINWLRAQMAAQTKAESTGTYSIYETADGRVILDEETGVSEAGEEIRVKTVYSADIEKNYGYEQFIGGKLRVKCSNTFESTVSAGRISENNPVRTVVEELSFRNDGTPVIKVSEKEYKVNRVRYNLN